MKLIQFRNYEKASFQTPGRIVCITGPNGSGKTTILDAVHYACFTRSYFAHSDQHNVRNGNQGFRIDATLEELKPHEVTCILREDGRKEFSLDQEPCKQFSSHIGRFPCIFIAPDDTELISGAGELRRRFLDTMIGQVSSDYLQSLIRYNRVLQQRNALLKLWALSGTVDTALLDVYSQQLAEQGTLIYHQRKNYLEHYIPLVKLLYATLCMEQEPCSIQYQSALNDHLMYPMLQSALEKDRVLQRTTAGIHRDDLVFKLNDMPLKQVASQGQRKSFLFALKLAQYEMVSRLTGKQALLLLDDLFEKLDEKRSRQLTEYILQCSGQVWITDTHVERLLPAFEQSEQEVTWISLTNE